MSLIIAVFVSLFSPTAESEGLRSTAPADLTAESASEHLESARIAAAEYRVNENLLLSIAYHESHYDQTARTPEPGHKVSCGVMTPVPGTTCTNGTVLDGYRAGAEHLDHWLHHSARRGEAWNEHKALLGYAGGYVLIDACAKGPVMKLRKDGHSDNVCLTPEVFWYRAKWIKRARDKVTNS